MMRALGAEVVLVDQVAGGRVGEVSGDDLALVEAETGRIVRERGAFRADQFTLPANVHAHERGTGAETLAQTGGAFNAFCDFVGSAGTFTGCARAFKRADAAIRCYAVEPAGAAVLQGEPASAPSHLIQGGGYARPHLRLFDRALADGYLAVTGEEARAAARLLARTEGVFAGFSSGANFAAACQLLRDRHEGGTAVIMLCSSGLKYLTTDLWD